MRSASRRTLLARAGGLATVTAAGAALAVPTGAAALAPDPHPGWLREALAHVAWINGPRRPGVTDEEVEARHDEVLRLEDMISETPASGLAGALAQVRLVHRNLDVVGGHSEFDVEALANAAATLEALVGRAAT